MKKSYIISLAIILMIACFLSMIISNDSITTEPVSATLSDFQPTIIIDAGHGGEDGGAIVGNILEKNINLSISKKLKDYMISSGFDVKMIRETDTAVYDSSADSIAEKKRSDLNNRLKIFNSSPNNVIISIHQNKFEQPQYFGTQIFYSPNNEKSKLLSENIKTSVISLIQPENNRQSKSADNSIFVLKNCKNPAVMVECGFMSNDSELKKLRNEEYQNKIAYCIWLGLMEFLYTNYN